MGQLRFPTMSNESEDIKPVSTRKKRTFDIAFLTGQNESNNNESKKASFQHEDANSETSDTSSMIDVLTNGSLSDVECESPQTSPASHPVNPRIRDLHKPSSQQPSKKNPDEIRFESKRIIDIDSNSLKIKETATTTLSHAFNIFPPSFNLFPQLKKSNDLSHYGLSIPPYPCAYPAIPNLIPPQLSPPGATAPTPNPATLLPPSLTALTLPAQNVCAKCNIGFRMTSDLVYHMRSHHKRDTQDPLKKQREEKLKCPVCHESFRERHHLTRHMTAHQDRGDEQQDNAHPPSLVS